MPTFEASQTCPFCEQSTPVLVRDGSVGVFKAHRWRGQSCPGSRQQALPTAVWAAARALESEGWHESTGPFCDTSACVAEDRGLDGLWDDGRYAHPFIACEMAAVSTTHTPETDTGDT